MNIIRKIRLAVKKNSVKVAVILLSGVIGVIASGHLLTVAHPSGMERNVLPVRQHQTNLSGIRLVDFTMRTVTAYSVGDSLQTDSRPCVGAGHKNLCHALALGEKICAANFVPLNTYLYIQDYGIYRVADRMNSRFGNRVDIAMGAWQKERALDFGVKTLAVSILR